MDLGRVPVLQKTSVEEGVVGRVWAGNKAVGLETSVLGFLAELAVLALTWVPAELAVLALPWVEVLLLLLLANN